MANALSIAAISRTLVEDRYNYIGIPPGLHGNSMPTRPRRLDLHYLSVVPRRTLIIGYGVAAIVILLIEACYFLSEFILRFEVPYFDFRNIPTTVLFAAIICIGLCCASFRHDIFHCLD
jgi:hypothetical protein